MAMNIGLQPHGVSVLACIGTALLCQLPWLCPALEALSHLRNSLLTALPTYISFTIETA